MTSLGNVRLGNQSFDFEEANIYGIYEKDGIMTWHIELLPPGEDNYIMFNSLVFNNVFSPPQLSNIALIETSATSDLYEYTVSVEGEERFLKSVDMVFRKWETTNQSIQLIGSGIIHAEDNLSELTYSFNAILHFKQFYILQTSEAETQKFVDTYLPDSKQQVTIQFENVASGRQAIIKGQFQ